MEGEHAEKTQDFTRHWGVARVVEYYETGTTTTASSAWVVAGDGVLPGHQERCAGRDGECRELPPSRIGGRVGYSQDGECFL